MTTQDNELRTTLVSLRGAITELRAEIVRLREDLADPTGEERAERRRAAQEVKDRAFDLETQRLVELAERR